MQRRIVAAMLSLGSSDKPEIAKRLQTLILGLAPNSESIDLPSWFSPTHCSALADIQRRHSSVN